MVFFTAKKEGVRLGLIITQEIIEGHNGSIKVSSSVEKETEFILRFPLVNRTSLD